MSLCIFCDEKGFRQGAKYKRHLYKDGMCTRCRRSQFVKTKKKEKKEKKHENQITNSLL
jgi:hypothetical protein